MVALAFLTVPAKAQWEQVGDPIPMPRQDFRTTLALDINGTPYVATIVDTYGYELVVLKWDGTYWTQLGHTNMLYDSPPVSLNIALTISSVGVPYVAVTAYSTRGDSLIVKRYDGNDWITLDSSSIFSQGANRQRELFLAIDRDDTPYIALSDHKGIRVLKYDGTSWESTEQVATVGNIAGFGFDTKGSLRIAFESWGRAVIMNYENSKWDIADTNGLNAVKHEAIWMPLDCKGTGEYAAMLSFYRDNPQVIMKQTGTSWAPLVNGDFPFRMTVRGLMADARGTPYVFVVDSFKRSLFLKHDGANWAQTDTSGLPSSPTGHYSNMVGDGNNHFYIVPINLGQTDGLRIMKYTVVGTTGANSNARESGITIAPVPASQSVRISNGQPSLNGAEMTITDISGRKVYQFILSASQEIDIQNWSPGIYFVRLPDGSVRKILVS